MKTAIFAARPKNLQEAKRLALALENEQKVNPALFCILKEVIDKQP